MKARLLAVLVCVLLGSVSSSVCVAQAGADVTVDPSLESGVPANVDHLTVAKLQEEARQQSPIHQFVALLKYLAYLALTATICSRIFNLPRIGLRQHQTHKTCGITAFVLFTMHILASFTL